MPATPEPIEYEPFGQHGVRQLARPLSIAVCSVGVACSMAMIVRSYSYFDLLWKQENQKRIDVASAIGRLMITTRTSNRSSPSSEWVYESAEIGNLEDGWKPGIWKTIGVEWGTETFTTFSGRVVSVWRFRLQWRTVLIVCLAPVLVDAYAKRRARTLAALRREADALSAPAR